MKKDQMVRKEQYREAVRLEGEKIKRSFGWGITAYSIIMKNKIVISCCLLFQGFFWVFNPKGSLEWDIMILSILALLYAVAGLLVLITGGNSVAVKGQKKVGEMYREKIDGKRKQFSEPAERLSDVTVVKAREEELHKEEERVKEFSNEAKKKIATKKNLLIVCYVLLMIVSITIIIFKSFFSGAVFVILGVILTAEGVFSFITWMKTKDSVKPRDRAVSLTIAVFSVLLGVVLVFFPIFTGNMVIRFIGIGILLKAVTELVIGFRNRSLILDTKETISEIKNI
ncbi:MAG: hypothetical protein IKH09_08225 [Clostridia bacterium]|nr:hypothetical protein [Clostridia bacterium]